MSLKLKSEEARENIKRHRFVRFLAGAAIVVMVGFVIYTIISDNISIRENEKRLNALVAETNAVIEQNEQINTYLENEDNLDDYIKNIAREKLDFANANERIYYVVPSADD